MFNEILVGRINRYVQKLLQIKNTALRTIGPELQLTLPLFSGVEDRYLQGWNRYTGSWAVNAVAAQFSRMLLQNPKGSNVIAVVESLFPNSGAMDWGISTGQALGNTQGVGTQLRRLDSRQGFTDSTLQLQFDNSASQTPGAAFVLMRHTGTEVIVHPNQEITLLPNDGLWIVSDAVNLAAQVYVIWRERSLESSELT